MSSQIRVLTEQTINKIAAGEVIENPASVVKELIENALDADSSFICVEIVGGGRQLIRVSDDGVGMSPDDAVLCLERHATSKIKDVEDIEQLITMGFRGEALPSIAAISKFSLLTSLRENKKNANGTLVLVEGGKILSCAPAYREPGTTIEVKSLFYNVPVRRKFQKSPTYDTQEVLRIMTLLALGNPHVQFELISDQKTLLKKGESLKDLSFKEQLSKRIEMLLGKEFFDSLVPIEFVQEPYQIDGFVGLPSYNRPNRTGQYLFLNRRSVYSSLISQAIREGFGTMLPTHRYPVFVLHLRMSGTLVDVNVHPQKKEVRLRHEMALKEVLIQAVQAAFRKETRNPSPPLSPSSLYEEILFPCPPLEEKLRHDLTLPESSPPPSFIQKKQPLEAFSFEPPLQVKTASSLPLKPHSIVKILKTFIGFILLDSDTILHHELFKNYSQGMCIVHQHSAHHRIIYDGILSSRKKNSPQSQSLLFPETVELSLLEAQLLNQHIDFFSQMGFSIRELGSHTFLVDAIPAIFNEKDISSLFSEMLKELKEENVNQHQKEKQIARFTSRFALSSSIRLSHEQAQSLIDQLLQCEVPLLCPMGKPTITCLSYEDLQKIFKKGTKE